MLGFRATCPRSSSLLSIVSFSSQLFHSIPRLSPLIRERKKQREPKKERGGHEARLRERRIKKEGRRKEEGRMAAISTGSNHGEIHEKNGVCARFTISGSGVGAERKDEQEACLVTRREVKGKCREAAAKRGICARNLCPTKAGWLLSIVPFDIPRWNSVKYLTYREWREALRGGWGALRETRGVARNMYWANGGSAR